MCPVNHRMLDKIARLLKKIDAGPASPARWSVSRESECIEFTDPINGKHYEIVIQPIDERS